MIAYIQFSERIEAIPPKAMRWVVYVLNFKHIYESDEEAKEVLSERLEICPIDLDGVDLKKWPGFAWQVQSSGLLISDNGNSSFPLDEIKIFTRSLIKTWMPRLVFTMTWSKTTHSPKKFGGGWLLVTDEIVDHVDNEAEVRQRAWHVLKDV